MANAFRMSESTHATKSRNECFPRSFKEVSRILREVRKTHRSLKSAVYSSKWKGWALKKIFGLSNSVLRNMPTINRVIDEIGLLSKEPSICLETAQLLVHEMINKHPLPGQSKPILIMEKYRHDVEKISLKLKAEKREKSEMSNAYPLYAPRYARVQTTVTSVESALKVLLREGYVQKHLDDNISLARYHKEVRNLKHGEFLQDKDFKDVLVFPKGENLFDSYLFTNGHIFLHDKASYLPVYVLDPKPESIVLDCCAAPGMKTAHLACVMKNTGHIYAVDRDYDRFLVMKKTLSHGLVKNCTSYCMDFTKINPYKEPYSSVQYILLDPSCSGSGIMERMSSFKDDDYSSSHMRVHRLARFQITLLKHALSFPRVKRVVYSTCSIHEEENEYVIDEALREFSGIFRVDHAFPEWPTRGSNKYSFGKLCLRTSPTESLTNGFFVALINRVDDINETSFEMKNKAKDKMRYKRRRTSFDKLNIGVNALGCEDNVDWKKNEETENYAVKSVEIEEHKQEKVMGHENEMCLMKSGHDDTSIQSLENENDNQVQLIKARKRSRKCKKKRKDKERPIVEGYRSSAHKKVILWMKNDNTPVEALAYDHAIQVPSMNIKKRSKKCKRKTKDKERDDAHRPYVMAVRKENSFGAPLSTQNEYYEGDKKVRRRKCKRKRRDKERPEFLEQGKEKGLDFVL